MKKVIKDSKENKANFYNQLLDLGFDPTEHFDGYIVNKANLDEPLFYIENFQIGNINQVYFSLYTPQNPYIFSIQPANNYYLDSRELEIEKDFVLGEVKYLILKSKELNNCFSSKNIRLIIKLKYSKEYRK